MSEGAIAVTEPVCALLAVPVGRNGWISKKVMLHYEASRLIKAEGTDLAQKGSMGLTGTLYVVKESLCRDNRLVMRIERQKIVNGKVVDMQNWGEIEDAVPRAA
jgi:hypothetical protein